jgi:hypothetical protein
MKTITTLIISLTVIIALAAGSAFGSYSGGTGDPNNPYQIATKADLLVLASDANDYVKCFILTADINMEGQVFTTAIIAPDTSSSSGFQGTAFAGTFDGNGHKITNFTINEETNNYIGLFGYINSGGSVKNLGLENCSVSGTAYVGGLVGYSGGNISNCYSTGTVGGSVWVGGLVGDNGGGSSITNCYSTGAVSGGSQHVGGLVGMNNSSITNCYSTGSVIGSSNSYYVSGLVGTNFTGSISNCYSTGSVSGSSDVGGLVGYNNSDINNCYSTCSVSGDLRVGGLVGSNSGSVSSSFWDINTSGQPASAGGTGETTAQMKTLSTFTSAGWDFVNVWGIGNSQTYPYLKLLTGFNPADLNYSGMVDFADFAILAANWLNGE